MNISPVSENIFYKVNLNRNNHFISTNFQPQADCFIKSKTISFSGISKKEERQKTVDSYMRDLAAKLFKPNFSIGDISNSMQKFTKNVNVKPMSQAPKDLIFASSLQGLYCEDLNFDEANNRFFIPKKNRIFYTKTETLKSEFGNIWVFINSVHEFTHVLQSEDSSINHIDLFNDYIERNKDNIDDAINQVNTAARTVNIIEESIARPFINLLEQNEDLAYERIQSGQTNMLSWLCRKNRTEDFSNYVKEKTATGIKTAEEKYSTNLDKRLVLDTTINHFKKELEAYENENKAFKICLRMDSPRALTRIQIYQKSIEALEEMKKETI